MISPGGLCLKVSRPALPTDVRRGLPRRRASEANGAMPLVWPMAHNIGQSPNEGPEPIGTVTLPARQASPHIRRKAALRQLPSVDGGPQIAPRAPAQSVVYLCMISSFAVSSCSDRELGPTIMLNVPGSTTRFMSSFKNDNLSGVIENCTFFVSPGRR